MLYTNKFAIMAKRFGHFQDSPAKKAKTDNDVDDLWGEDPDIDDVDDCIMLASQVMENQTIVCTQLNNVSILPSYSAFRKEQNVLVTSTQLSFRNSFNEPSTSQIPLSNVFRPPPSKNDDVATLQMRLKKLQQEYEAKEGEASILRTQLRQSRSSIETENAKRQAEWNEKVNSATKQMNAYKTELEFKNLEIANLKQKVQEISKTSHEHSLSALTNGSVNKSKIQKASGTTESKSVTETTENQNIPMCLPRVERYPLKFLVDSDLFKPQNVETTENGTFARRENLNLLRNESQEEIMDIYPKTFIDKSELRYSFITAELAQLCKSSQDDLSSEESYTAINKIILTCHQLTHNFYCYIQSLEKTMKTDDIRQEDTLYLGKKINLDIRDISLFDSREMCENEMGVPCRRILAFISELLRHSHYLQVYLLNKTPIQLNASEDYVKFLRVVELEKTDNVCFDNYKFINLLYSLANILGRTRKSYKTPGILAAITNFAGNICSTDYFDKVSDIVMKIFKEVVFARPNNMVLISLAEFLERVSLNHSFIRNLCTMSSKTGLSRIEKQGITYFNLNSCVFQVFSKLYEEYLLPYTERYAGCHLNILHFILNAFESDAKWLHYQENNHCECLLMVNKLCIGILFKTLEAFTGTDCNSVEYYSKGNKDIYQEILYNGVRILSELTFRSYDLLQKCLKTYSQYKVDINSILKIQGNLNLNDIEVDILERLNINEDIPEKECKNFNTDLWMEL